MAKQSVAKATPEAATGLDPKQEQALRNLWALVDLLQMSAQSREEVKAETLSSTTVMMQMELEALEGQPS